MVKTAAILALTSMLALSEAEGLAQEKNANPDLVYKKDSGVSVMKPQKNEEWGFPKDGFFSNSEIVVGHKVDTLTIDISVQDKAGGLSYYDPKAAADSEYKNIAGFNGVTDAQRQPVKAVKLPGGGAGNVGCHLLEMSFKREGQAKELKMWCFIAKENQNLVKITLVGDEGMYKKHQKHVDYILSSIKTWKLPK
jgi:hypothetical protein